LRIIFIWLRTYGILLSFSWERFNQAAGHSIELLAIHFGRFTGKAVNIHSCAEGNNQCYMRDPQNGRLKSAKTIGLSKKNRKFGVLLDPS